MKTSYSMKYRNYRIDSGMVQVPGDLPVYWAEVLRRDEPLQRWYGITSIRNAKEWVDEQILLQEVGKVPWYNRVRVPAWWHKLLSRFQQVNSRSDNAKTAISV